MTGEGTQKPSCSPPPSRTGHFRFLSRLDTRAFLPNVSHVLLLPSCLIPFLCDNGGMSSDKKGACTWMDSLRQVIGFPGTHLEDSPFPGVIYVRGAVWAEETLDSYGDLVVCGPAARTCVTPASLRGKELCPQVCAPPLARRTVHSLSGASIDLKISLCESSRNTSWRERLRRCARGLPA